MDHEEVILPHSELLQRLEASTKSAHLRIDAFMSVANSVQELTINFTKLVSSIEQQGRDLTTMVRTLERHENKIESIEDKMETKDTVARLHGKVEEIQEMIRSKEAAEKDSKIKDFKEMQKYITKILIGVGIGVIASLVIFAVIVLSALANSGALPTP